MYAFLSSFIQYLLNPLLWVLICLLAIRYYYKNKHRALLYGILIFMFFSNWGIGNYVMRLWEYRTIGVDDIERPYDIGIVLGGYAFFDSGKPNADQLFYFGNQSINRLTQAVELYHLGKVKKLLLTGIITSNKTNEITRKKEMIQFLGRMGIDEEDIIMESAAQNTFQEAINVKRIDNEPNKGVTKNQLKL